jgi:Spy/CpxP family protein refolding chaperone
MGGMGTMGYGMGPQGMFYGNPGAAVESRLEALKSELKITSDQEAAWQAYAAQSKHQAESMQASITAKSGAQSPAPESFALHNEFMKQRFEQAEATNAAFKDLYAVLTPEQRAIADQGYVAHGPGFRGPGGRYR